MTDTARNFKFNQSRRGFTLIELLVVIAIIAIIAAILFPVFAKVREKARQTQCLSNEKQINLAMMQYVQDYDETWPDASIGAYPTAIYNLPYTTQTSWAVAIYPYIKSQAVFACPDDPYTPSTNDVQENYTPLVNAGVFADIKKSYIPIVEHNYNGKVDANANTAIMIVGQEYQGATDPARHTTDSSIPDPAATMWLTEAGENLTAPGGACANSPCTNTNVVNYGLFVDDRAKFLPGGTSSYSIANYHTGGTNWCFGDGHVKWYQLSQTINTTNLDDDLWVREKP